MPASRMILIVIFVAGIVATTIMTLFSYLLSLRRSYQFREPELLNRLTATSDVIGFNPSRNGPWGWCLHYTIGWSFIVVFYAVWRLTPLTPDLASGAGMGFVAGIIGIAGWRTLFALSSSPPSIRFRKFYIHLLVAHILFGVSAVLVFMGAP